MRVVWKFILGFIFAAALIAGLSACYYHPYEKIEVDGLIYGTYGERYTVIGYTDEPENVEIPASLDKPVTGISATAFRDCVSLVSVSVPSSVTVISAGAFGGCTNLTTLSVAEDNPVYFSAGNCVIERTGKLIVGCSGSVIPDDGRVTSIGSLAFLGCGRLAAINIPASVTLIEENAIYGCNALEAFNVDVDNPSYSDFDGVLYNKQMTEILQTPKAIRAVTFPAELTEIGENTFYGCTELQNAVVHDGVVKIGSGAFGACAKLESLTLPFVGESADAQRAYYSTLFGYIFGTEPFEGGSTVVQAYKISDYASRFTRSYYLPNSLKRVTVTGGKVFECAFINCKSLESVNIACGEIERYAFAYCTSLQSANIEGEQIQEYVFYGCTALKSVALPADALSALSADNRKLLTDVVISRGESLDETAFYNCVNVEHISLPSGLKRVADGALSALPNTALNAFNGAYYAGNEENPYLILVRAADKSVTNCAVHSDTVFIHSSAFEDCANLISADVGSSVTAIGGNAFRNCRSLVNLTLSDGLVNLSGTAFDNCVKLGYNLYGNGKYLGSDSNPYVVLVKADENLSTEIHPDTKIIYRNAFLYYKLKTVEIPNGVKTICPSAFYSSDIESVTIPSSVEVIGEGAFWGCDNLVSADISEGVLEIGNWAFGYCMSLKNAYIPSSVTYIGDSVFCNGVSLESVTVAEGNAVYRSEGDCIIEKLTGRLVFGCHLSEIPDSVKEIGSAAFEYANGLEFIIIPDGVEIIGESAFRASADLKGVVIGSGVKWIDGYAFWDCGQLEGIYYRGTQAEWEDVFKYPNANISGENVYFYSQTRPEGEGNYWRFGENNQVEIW